MSKHVLSKFLEKQRLKFAGSYLTGNVLDLGCGNAALYQQYQKRIDKYIGIDSNKHIIQKNSKSYPEAVFYTKNLDDEDLRFEDKFDVIVMIALIEHIFNQKKLFSEVKKYLKPNGVIVITTPTPFGNDFVHAIGCKIGLFAKKAGDDHIIIYNKKRFEILAKEIGLKIAKYETFEFGLNQFVILTK